MGVKRLTLWLPLAAFLIVLGVVAAGLITPADRTIHSALVGKPLPSFALAPMVSDKPGVASAAFRHGRPRLLNVFASWCVPCEAEAPQLMRLKAMGVPIDAVAIHDSRTAVADFLRRNGDPYAAIGNDPGSAVQLAIGSSGVPETFVIAGDGTILNQHVGAIRDEDVADIARAAGVIG
jgi:cytochrome c biogenesis protein CcmG/thiol:disulfide interchange protein DsbE